MVQGHASAHGSVAGRYRLLEILHRETNHICWYGEDGETERPLLLTQTGLPEGTGQDGARRITARVLRMSETMGLLRPGRVATVVDAVVEAGTLWTVAEWIDGVPLGELLAREGALPPARAARIGLELLEVLEAAHAEGITHGELGPGQVLVRDGGGVVVTGFGLVGATLVPRLTAPSYASPEQARDERIGPAADLWALGALLYTMTEGRPPFRDRGRPEATLRGVVRLPVRAPLRTGPLERVVQGLLRKNYRDRPTRPVVREALTRIADEDPGTAAPAASRPRPPATGAAVRARSGRTVVLGTALAATAVTAAVLAAALLLPGTKGPGTVAAPGTAGSSSFAAGSEGRSGQGTPPPAGVSPSAGVSPPATATGLPAGFRPFTASEGFSLALPEGWRRVSTTRASDRAYRVVFGADGDARTLAVTYSTQAGPDPVVIWRDEVEPALAKRQQAYRRIGSIRATTYQGREAADMEWLSGTGDERVRTFGRGFLLGGGRSFSLRWTTPADDFTSPANRQTLKVFLRTFRPGPV